MPQPSRRVLLGVGLVCFANLLLEIVLTRIFSATIYYHFTFLAVALALLGMSASGVYIYVRGDLFAIEDVRRDLATNARRFAIATVVALIYVLANPIDLGIGGPAQHFNSQTFFQLLLLTAATGVPFFFAGMVVALSVLHYREQISRVYAADLAGAAMAALAAGPALLLFGGPGVVLLISVLLALTSVLLGAGSRKHLLGLLVLLAGAAAVTGPVLGAGGRAGLVLQVAALSVLGVRLLRTIRTSDVVVVVTLVVMAVANVHDPVVRVFSGKGVKSERLAFEAWNAFSRITVERLKSGELDIKIDASAATRITSLKRATPGSWRGNVSAVAHVLFPDGAGDVLIIGPGGGPDVVNALAASARKVTAVEINPIIAETVMLDRFRTASDGLYADPRVELVVDEGRSFVRRSEREFDIIQATLVDTWAATASGAFALTESSLYTVEAFVDFYQHLTPSGAIAMSRWHSGRDPETARLIVLAAAGLVRLGIAPEDVRKHIVFVAKDSLGTLIAKRTPFTSAELLRIHEAADARAFSIVVAPDNPTANHFQKLVDDGPYGRYVRKQEKDLSPPTDDRPFFFYFVRARDFVSLDNDKLVNPAMWVLLGFGGTIIILVAGFIVLPLLAFRRDVLVTGGFWRVLFRVAALSYFCAIGFAFIVVEIALMQKLGLFLGHPSYGLMVVLFSILLGTAAGARATALVRSRARVAVAAGIALLVSVMALLCAWKLGDALHDRVAWPLAGRVALAGGLVAAFGFFMGFLLPSGVSCLAETDPAIIPWGWGLNGAMSVLGTAFATVMAIHHGFDATLLCGGVAYIVSALFLVSLARLSRNLARGD